ncbi:hypothetical protein YC2023_094059 [Brassica napus]
MGTTLQRKWAVVDSQKKVLAKQVTSGTGVDGSVDGALISKLEVEEHLKFPSPPKKAKDPIS